MGLSFGSYEKFGASPTNDPTGGAEFCFRYLIKHAYQQSYPIQVWRKNAWVQILKAFQHTALLPLQVGQKLLVNVTERGKKWLNYLFNLNLKLLI